MTLRRQLVLSLLLLVVVVLSAVAVYMWFGGPQVTLLDAFYMAVVTISTVGYSEIVNTQTNPALRLFNIFFILIGIGIMLYAFSASTAFIVEGELNHIFRRRKMEKLIRDMHDHLIICGAGETGTYLVKELLKTGNVFVVIDHEEERLGRISKLGEVPVLKGDGGDEGVLTAARIQTARGLASVLPEDKDNLLTTVTARQLNPNLRIVARLCRGRHGGEAPASRRQRRNFSQYDRRHAAGFGTDPALRGQLFGHDAAGAIRHHARGGNRRS